MKYKVGFLMNPGYDEYGQSSITHVDIVCIEQGDLPKPPSGNAMWKKFKDDLKDVRVVRLSGKGKPEHKPIQRSDLFVTLEGNLMYSRMFLDPSFKG